MNTITQSALDLIGSTPLLALKHFSPACKAQLLAKLEYFNPAGSTKDRAALSMILDAEARGLLSPGGTILEPTSGNTGIGMAMVAAVRGYHVILTLPETMSMERRRMLAAYGAELVLTPGAEGMSGAIRRAKELQASIPGSIILGQFDNPANPEAHYRTTGPEIWQQTEGRLDIFVAGVGTGGTISGCARFLKEKNPAVRVVAVEPAGSAVISGKAPGPHGLQGIGAGFLPANLDRSLLDEVIPITDEEAYEAGRRLGRTEGVLAGISSGAALSAAERLAKRPENKGKTIVALLPDSGDRYLSTPLFS